MRSIRNEVTVCGSDGKLDRARQGSIWVSKRKGRDSFMVVSEGGAHVNLNSGVYFDEPHDFAHSGLYREVLCVTLKREV